MTNGKEPSRGSKPIFIGLDLGGTHVKVGIGRGDAELIWQDEVPSRASEGRDAILETLIQVARRAQEEAQPHGEVVGIGLGTPGVIDGQTGEVLHKVSNLAGWKGVNPSAHFQREMDLPAVVENDANVAALAEARFGAGRGAESVVMATVGTGIGGGAVVGGRILRGARGAAMEFGHIPYQTDGRPCGCGMRGCLETYSGTRGILSAWRHELEAAGLDRVANTLREDLTFRHLLEAESSGDERSRRLLKEGARALGVGLVTLLHLFNPHVLVLGGGVLDGCPWFGDLAIDGLRARALPKVLTDLEIRRAEFGNQAGMLGAIALAASVLETQLG